MSRQVRSRWLPARPATGCGNGTGGILQHAREWIGDERIAGAATGGGQAAGSASVCGRHSIFDVNPESPLKFGLLWIRWDFGVAEDGAGRNEGCWPFTCGDSPSSAWKEAAHARLPALVAPGDLTVVRGSRNGQRGMTLRGIVKKVPAPAILLATAGGDLGLRQRTSHSHQLHGTPAVNFRTRFGASFGNAPRSQGKSVRCAQFLPPPGANLTARVFEARYHDVSDGKTGF